MVLGIRPSEKYVMLLVLDGFVYSLNHPDQEMITWDLEVQTLSGDTSSIVRQIRNHKIPYEEVLKQVNEVYESLLRVRPGVSKCSQYNNISYYYRNKLVRIFKEMLKKVRSKKRQGELEEQLKGLGKQFSLEAVR